MQKPKDGEKSGKRMFISVMLLVTLMLAGSYIATMNQTADVSASLTVERVPIETPESDPPEATTGSAVPEETPAPSGAPGDANSSGFSQYKSTIAATRSEAAALLDEVIADGSASVETVQQAILRKTELAGTITMETEMETLIKARGFSDVLCTVSQQSVNVVVQCDGLTQQQASQIMDIAVSVTGQPASHVKIITSE